MKGKIGLPQVPNSDSYIAFFTEGGQMADVMAGTKMVFVATREYVLES